MKNYPPRSQSALAQLIMKLFASAFAAAATLLTLTNAEPFSNPLKEQDGSDPQIVWSGGYYYLLTTTWTNVQITRATTLGGLKTGETKVVWEDDTPSRCCNMWAPEIQYLDGSWYLYYTAGESGTTDGQHTHVLTGGATPWDTYTYSAQLLGNEWAIDSTVLRFDSGNYLVYSCIREGLQGLCIAPLESPTSVGAASTLSLPTNDWERKGDFPVNEGPAPFYHGGKTYLTFSASQCWSPSYQLGLLTWDGSGDPTNMDSWTKTGPVFSSANGNYGTGHNQYVFPVSSLRHRAKLTQHRFFTSPDGTEIWNVYHATAMQEGACDGNRYTSAQPMSWNADGTPDFGKAVEVGETIPGPSGE